MKRPGARVGVDVDGSHHAVASLHGDADRLANTHLEDAGRRIPALVLSRIAGQHAFFVLHHIVEDRAADLQLLAFLRGSRGGDAG